MARPATSPYPAPPEGAPLRLAFVGQQTYFRACAMDEDSDPDRTAFLDYRDGRDPELLRARLAAFAPHAVVVFRPETRPGRAAGRPAVPILGFLTEPISERSRRPAACTGTSRSAAGRWPSSTAPTSTAWSPSTR